MMKRQHWKILRRWKASLPWSSLSPNVEQSLIYGLHFTSGKLQVMRLTSAPAMGWQVLLVLGGSSWQKQLRIRSGGVSKFVHRKKRYDNIADMKLQKAPHTFATSWLFLLAATHDEGCRSAWMSSQNSWTKREYFSRSIGVWLLNYIFNFYICNCCFWHIIQFNK